MNANLRSPLLAVIAAVDQLFRQAVIFRGPAQKAHDDVLGLLRALDRLPIACHLASALHRSTAAEIKVEVGGARLSQRLILAAGLVKGDGFCAEDEALAAAADGRRNIIPGWRIVPAVLGPAEFGSFTRYPRPGNAGTVVWRRDETRSTQNRVGLRNPGARAAAQFLGARRDRLPKEYGINIALSPGLDDIARQEQEVTESLGFFLDAGVYPTWFTLNLSCPNTEDDPHGYQLEAETRRICGAFVSCLSRRKLDIPLWVKLSPGLAAEQYQALIRVFSEVGVKAVVASNTLAKASPDDASLIAGIGGGELFDDALAAVGHLRAAKKRGGYKIDLIGCGGILDGESLRKYEQLGVRAAQYWSALVFRGAFAAALIESELASHETEIEAVHRESLA
ncbi:MAG: hypothetical protein OXG78_15550 [Chloroflexi bacterium]|nr:hypothetical protein [Chloroflexota bacterium]